MSSPRLSLVIPFHNESGNVRPVLAAACAVLAELDPAYEALLVDDGSTDATPRELADWCAREPRCRVITFAQNRGQAAALWTGLHEARGEIILAMDGDGQNDPADFPALLRMVTNDGLDVACGWRRDRHDSLGRRLMSRFSNRVRRHFLADGLHDAGCQLRALRRSVLPALELVPLFQSFLPAQAAAAGFKVGERVVRHHPRQTGQAHYGLRNLWWRPGVEMLRQWRRQRRRPRPTASGR